jgi:phosphoribosylanthranilate isomerase
MTKIKFCGLAKPSDAAHALAVGATYGGVIMTNSIRRVSSDQARQIFAAAPQLKRVGVFGLELVAEILRSAEKASLDVLQLHGHFSSEDCTEIRQEFEGEIWSVLSIDENATTIPEKWKDLADSADALLLDTSIGGQTGGTGRHFQWEALSAQVREITREIPIVLAGGLNSENVIEAIGALDPAVVDVSSGVESAPGVKSEEMMTAFARAVLSASIV